jgi:hypothetical protein
MTALVGLSQPAIQTCPFASTVRLCGMLRGFGRRYSSKVALATSGASLGRCTCSGLGGSAFGPKYWPSGPNQRSSSVVRTFHSASLALYLPRPMRCVIPVST